MEDYLGNEVQVGDEVAYVEPRYSNLRKGTVKKINPKSITIQMREEDVRFSKDWVVRYPDQFVKA